MNDTSYDSIIFDIDGVLIDVSGSYDTAINRTCSHVLGLLRHEPVAVTGEIIDMFKESGGFNDEVDLTYACVLLISAARRTGQDPYSILQTAAAHADRTGIDSVMKHAGGAFGAGEVGRITKRLGMPGDRDGVVQQTFDQIFYGPIMYERLFGRPCPFDEGMIDSDSVIITGGLLDTLAGTFGKRIAIVSGRGYEAASYSLGPLMEYFDVESSAFLEDMPRIYAKPNPKPLIDAIVSMGSSNCIYAGDSMEDYIMARDARRAGHKVLFLGIIGATKNPEKRRAMFEQAGADHILDSIHEIPKVL